MNNTSTASVRDHYDAVYAQRQIDSSELCADVELAKFRDFVQPTDVVLDFGCGVGSILRRLVCAERIGIEINPTAAAVATGNGIRVFGDLDLVPDETVDLVISNHALEHTENPLAEMKRLRDKLKPGGRAVICVPCDRPSFPAKADDPDLHLFSWSANNLANLAKAAGFSVIEAREWVHRLPPKWTTLQRLLSARLFDLACVVAGALDRRRSQVRLVAKRS